MIFSAKYFNLDEDSGSIDGDRILERISAIPFEEWNDVPAQEFASKQNLFEKVVYNPEKQTVLLIGEIGDFLRTQEFFDKRFEFANMLYAKTEKCIKMRTLLTNYASFYAFPNI